MAQGAEFDPSAPLERGRAAFDVTTLFLVGALMVLGMVMVYSASVTVAGAQLDLARWHASPLRQSVFALAGFGGMVFAAHLGYAFFAWRSRADGLWLMALWLMAAGLLIVVLIPGIGAERLGAQRALVVLRHPISISFQPSEFAKLVLVIWLSALLSRGAVPRASAQDSVTQTDYGVGIRYAAGPARTALPIHDLLRGYLPALISAGLLVALTGIEDFGTAALMGMVSLALLYLGGARWWHLALTLLGALAGAAALVLHKPYRIQRIVTFFSESPDLMREGYQIDQALLAIASGGWWGRGLGAGVRKYDYLPQDNNDFIFAILCEELGIIGGLAVCVLFVLLMARGWWLSRCAADRHGQLLAAGFALLIGLQAAFNLGVVTNSVPTKGISLPFVSAGGSGVVFLGFAAGLLASVGGRQEDESSSARVEQRTS